VLSDLRLNDAAIARCVAIIVVVQGLRWIAVIAATMFVVTCTRHEEILITPFVKMDVRRPATGTSGVIAAGSRDEIVSTRSGSTWKRLGIGHSTSYMVLGEQQAVLIDLHDRNGPQLVRPDETPVRISEALGAGAVFVPSNSLFVDRFSCASPGDGERCREARIDRLNAGDGQRTSFTGGVPATLSDCQITRVIGYDRDVIPYFFADCRPDSAQAKCVVVAPRPGEPFVYVVTPDRQWGDCSSFPGLGVSLAQPQQYGVMDH
jgi:hypothetical protein